MKGMNINVKKIYIDVLTATGIDMTRAQKKYQSLTAPKNRRLPLAETRRSHSPRLMFRLLSLPLAAATTVPPVKSICAASNRIKESNIRRLARYASSAFEVARSTGKPCWTSRCTSPGKSKPATSRSPGRRSEQPTGCRGTACRSRRCRRRRALCRSGRE